MKRHVLLKRSPNEAILGLLLVLLLGLQVQAMCPNMCSCSHSHREVDCSWRGLRHLPAGLQHNVHSLNLSHNRLHNLDDQLTAYTHLRILDLSHNRLSHLPTGLPRSLWQLYATSNRIQLLDKNDTVYQWNLQILDLSDNKLRRAIFINNTLTNLCTLNLSHNQFWTLPTNMPLHLEAIDLSHNFLVTVLSGSLDRLPRLTHFYLHSNRFSTMPFGVFDKLASLRLITLGDNPWACHLYADITYLLSWTQSTPARVLGCPCHTHPVCGGIRPGRTGGWHFASYNLPPLASSAQDVSSMTPDASIAGWWYMTVSTQLSTQHTPRETHPQHHPFTDTPISISTLPPRGTGMHITINHHSASASPAEVDHMLHTDTHLISVTDSLHSTDTLPTRADMRPGTDFLFTTESSSVQTKKTTTLRTRSVRRKFQISSISNSSPALTTCSLLLFLNNPGLLSLILKHVL
ncbi:oligodendrocyte-myelin glycoprotein-like isoform X2 [Mastacembelus armatus]|uniref:Oligodendrocyte-myelin glycoprotein-like n=1 Tax=Mastacembelus armatus TaxID=205130 RepID=A0A3Q3LYS8_9TELE|nr:oligodendrocyte-myelin glycoprotein-like isoform X2 [Mastacembelus armatus]